MTDSPVTLDNFLAQFTGVHKSTPDAVIDLIRWCSSSDGATHDAPAVTDARFGSMLTDYTDWIMNTLKAPPGWTTTGTAPDFDPTDWPDGSGEVWTAWAAKAKRPTSGFVNYTTGVVHQAIVDWARAWTAANPS